MQNERWNIGDWVLCTNVEPMEEAIVFAHHPEGEFVTVKTTSGEEYSYPESSDNLVLIEVISDGYFIDFSEITNIDEFLMHLLLAPNTICNDKVKNIARRGLDMTNIKAKESVCHFLTLTPKDMLIGKWRDKSHELSKGCQSLAPMMKAAIDKKMKSCLTTPIKSSATLN